MQHFKFGSVVVSANVLVRAHICNSRQVWTAPVSASCYVVYIITFELRHSNMQSIMCYPWNQRSHIHRNGNATYMSHREYGRLFNRVIKIQKFTCASTRDKSGGFWAAPVAHLVVQMNRIVAPTTATEGALYGMDWALWMFYVSFTRHFRGKQWSCKRNGMFVK